jgi:ribosomal protein L30, bacterial/organelle
MAKVKITLTKSLIGRKANQIATANSFGLRKIGDNTIQETIPATEGKIAVISHLVAVEEV